MGGVRAMGREEHGHTSPDTFQTEYRHSYYEQFGNYIDNTQVRAFSSNVFYRWADTTSELADLLFFFLFFF